MAKPVITIEIEYFEGNNSITSINYPLGNNISGGSDLLSPNIAFKGFLLSPSQDSVISKLDGASKYYTRNMLDKAFISNEIADANGDINVVFTVNGTDIDNFKIEFDELVGEYATLINVDGIDYINDDYIFAWAGDVLNSHTITIKKWSEPNHPAKVLSILDGYKVVYDNNALKDVIIGSQEVADNELPEYGIISSYGNITIIDRDGEFKELAQMNILKSNLPIKVYLDGKLKATMSSLKWNYDDSSKIVKIELQDKLSSIANINSLDIFRINYRNFQSGESSAKVVFDYLTSFIPNINFTVSEKALNKMNLSKVLVYSNSSTNLLQVLNNFCQYMQLRIYMDESANAKVVVYE